MKNTLLSVFAVLVIIQFNFGQMCGPYVGITQLSFITGPCSAGALSVISDTNFSSNGTYELPYGSTYTGTWASGIGYSDVPGPEILCVSLHTEEGWDVSLGLSDGSYTAAQPVLMTTILDYVTWDMYDCGSGTLTSGWYYDRRIALVDFASYTIPPGLTVTGARFTLTIDNAGAPDPVGMMLIAGSSNQVNISNNGPICVGDTLELYADHIDSATYNWSGPLSFNSTLENPVIANATLANSGVYSCIITDGLNIDTAYTTVVINPNPTAQFVLPSSCENQSGIYSITAATDTISSYLWNFGTSALNDTSVLSSPSFTYTANGLYTITLNITSDEGCSAIIDTTISIHELPTATLSNTFVCSGTSQLFDPVVTGDYPLSYSWTFPSGSPSTSTDSMVVVNFPTSGNVNINLVLTSSFGCSTTFNFPITVSTGFNPNFGVYPICISRFTFDPLPSLDDSSWVIDWNMGDGTYLNDMDTSFFNHNYQSAGVYNVVMVVQNGAGCIDSVTIPVEVKDTVSIVMPNTLIQSSTVLNNQIDFEVLQPGFNLCITYTYSIYDRWGTLVFEDVNDPLDPDLYCSLCFKGKTQNGNDLSPGVYYYVLKGNFNIMKSGFITIFD